MAKWLQRGSRTLLALGLGLIVAAHTMSGEVSAKAADKVGENPTNRYSEGRGADLASDGASPPYEAGIGFSIGSIFHIHQHK